MEVNVNDGKGITRVELTNPGVYRAIKYYKHYQLVFGEDEANEMLDKSKDLAETILDFLDKDLAYNPVELLGVAMSPGLLE